MILAAEATAITHNAEYEKNKALLQEIERKIKKAAQEGEYYIQLDYPSLPPASVGSYLQSLGYKVTKNAIDPTKITNDNYFYTIRWKK